MSVATTELERNTEPAARLPAVRLKQRARAVLALSSGGGHWVQLLRLRPALEGLDVTWATVSDAYRADLADARFYRITDANRWDRLRFLRLCFELAWIFLRVRPHTIITTGAAPGYLALRMGRLLGARTIWVDSIANAEQLSWSGELAGRYADLWLTQWEHLARPGGPEYHGSVLS